MGGGRNGRCVMAQYLSRGVMKGGVMGRGRNARGVMAQYVSRGVLGRGRNGRGRTGNTRILAFLWPMAQPL